MTEAGLWTLKDVAAKLRLSESTVRRLVKRKALRGFKAGPKLWRFDPADVARYLTRKRD